jgi:formylglycine-generating enzyme required for sulfatase activity
MEQEKMRWISFPLMIATCVALCASRSDSQTFTTLVQFTGSGGTASGGAPYGSLLASGTTLYGMTSESTVAGNNYGNVFSVGTNGANYENLVTFTGTGGTAHGYQPFGSLLASGTTLYGMTQGGLANGDGNVFSVGMNGTNYRSLMSFGGTNGASPWGSLLVSGTTLYGMTQSGGANADGNVFSIGTNGQNYQNLLSFTGSGNSFHSGFLPLGDLLASGTTFYGMTSLGGSKGFGNVFSLGTNGTNYQNRLSFTGSGTGGTASVNQPYGNLLASGSTLYGMTSQGGADGYGNIFSVGTNGTNYQNLLSFTGSGTSGTANGSFPEGGSLVLSGTTLYGTTGGGGVDGEGNIFSVGINGSGYQDLYDFTGGTDGRLPWGDLLASGGTLFGMTVADGANGAGTIFALAEVLPTPEPGTLALVGAMFLVGFVWRRRLRRLAIIAVIALLPSGIARADLFNMPAGQTSLQFVTVGDPGNVADTTGYGAVPYTFNMGKYDVTLAQYTQFLNAVAKTDTYGLYNVNMAGVAPFVFPFGIAQTGSPGSYAYSVTGSAAGKVNMPLFAETWGDAARFCNWLQNGQPTGAEGNGTTETGAYNLNGAMSDAALMAVASPAHTGSGAARYFIPSETEWYKAAYYAGGGTSAGYWTYATQSNVTPSNSLVLAATSNNDANYYGTDPTNDLTLVGTFAASPGPYGTFDQSGDVWQWNETAVTSSTRGLRGGSWGGYFGYLASSGRNNVNPGDEANTIGFRVASSVAVPEPCTPALLGAAGFALLWHARRRSDHHIPGR